MYRVGPWQVVRLAVRLLSRPLTLRRFGARLGTDVSTRDRGGLPPREVRQYLDGAFPLSIGLPT